MRKDKLSRCVSEVSLLDNHRRLSAEKNVYPAAASSAVTAISSGQFEEATKNGQCKALTYISQCWSGEQ